jgi:hypothetical protein
MTGSTCQAGEAAASAFLEPRAKIPRTMPMDPKPRHIQITRLCPFFMGAPLAPTLGENHEGIIAEL